MGKKKLNLAYISDGTVRKASFKHRKKGLMKKLDQLKTICNVDACAVIYDPFNSNPEVWPSNSGVVNVIKKFEMLTEMEKTCRSVNQEGFLSREIAKVKKKSQKLAQENKEGYMRELMFGFLGGNMEGLCMQDNDRHGLCSYIDQYLIITKT
ncbi:hypothetical protein EUTSA_v10023913mg [Eutrema salsugineum]|uniref:MADS-box domain-containing protein n=1 Tax=Eutrema salsugineum TaxID=72664 RepID=V4MEB5_EUTSA|nr:hypothetical protein EUTSA_v10023913mg [Eutrema salsugineum]